jgi:hypothetical protein
MNIKTGPIVFTGIAVFFYGTVIVLTRFLPEPWGLGVWFGAMAVAIGVAVVVLSVTE